MKQKLSFSLTNPACIAVLTLAVAAVILNLGFIYNAVYQLWNETARSLVRADQYVATLSHY